MLMASEVHIITFAKWMWKAVLVHRLRSCKHSKIDHRFVMLQSIWCKCTLYNIFKVEIIHDFLYM